MFFHFVSERQQSMKKKEDKNGKWGIPSSTKKETQSGNMSNFKIKKNWQKMRKFKINNFLEMLAEHVLHIVVGHPHRVCFFSLSLRMQRLLDMPKLFLVILSHRVVAIDALFGHILVSTHLYISAQCVTQNRQIRWAQIDRGLFGLFYLSSAACVRPSASLTIAKVTKSVRCTVILTFFLL